MQPLLSNDRLCMTLWRYV